MEGYKSHIEKKFQNLQQAFRFGGIKLTQHPQKFNH